jgi:hypothetical protein
MIEYKCPDCGLTGPALQYENFFEQGGDQFGSFLECFQCGWNGHESAARIPFERGTCPYVSKKFCKAWMCVHCRRNLKRPGDEG